MIVTYPGRYGDVLWSLPTVREVAKEHGPVDFRIAAPFASLCPLLAFQPYIASAEALAEWTDLEALAPLPESGTPVLHLGDVVPTGRHHVRWDLPLCDAVLLRAGLTTWDHTPFIRAPAGRMPMAPIITAGFSDYCQAEAGVLLEQVQQAVGAAASVVRLETLPWLEAAKTLHAATVHLGCRSSLNVLAHGIGKPVVTWEPCAERRHPIFGYPYGDETLTTTTLDATLAVVQRVCR